MVILRVSDYARTRLGQRSSGAVHSVFSSSLNVALDGFLLHVGSSEAPLSCLGATVPACEMAELLAVAEPGDRALYRNGTLRIYNRSRVSFLTLDPAPVRPMGVKALETVLPDNFVASLRRELHALDLVRHIGLPWSDRSRDAVNELVRFSALCRRVGERGGSPRDATSLKAVVCAMRGAVAYLVGRGLGLTPSGDDVLMGFGTALRFLHREDVSNVEQVFFNAVSEEIPRKTTAVSEAYYQALTGGYANEDYLELLEVIRSRNASALRGALLRVLELGHTSGADSLLGFGAAFGCLC